jgi:capsular polysaccharide biosynthesis protein
MDLLLIARKVWRYKLITLPVVLLTLLGAVYVVVVKEPTYEASSSYILINPPPPPTAEDIARNPALGNVNADNPYTRFADQTVVVQLLASTLSGESARRALMNAGADSRYAVAPTSEFGYSTPIVQITGVGASPKVAVRTAKVVGQAVSRELDRLQQSEGVDSRYRIKTYQVDAPDGAQLRASGQLRALVGVLALGAVLLFVVVSVADALTTLRRERVGPQAAWPLAADNEPWPAEAHPAVTLSGLGKEDWLSGAPLDGNGADEFFPDPHSEATGAVSTNGRHAGRLPYREQHGSGR